MTFYHSVEPERPDAILVRGFSRQGVPRSSSRRVVLTDRPGPGAGEVVLRVRVGPSTAQLILFHERQRRAKGLRHFAVPPGLRAIADISRVRPDEPA